MKVFSNLSKDGRRYFSTSFYNKGLDGKTLSKNIFVDFQKGKEQLDTTDYDLIARDKNGKEYKVMLKAYQGKDGVEGKLFFFQDKDSIEKAFNDFVKDNNLEEPTINGLEISSDNLPFY